MVLCPPMIDSEKKILRFFKVATFCFDNCFAHSWHSLDELDEVVTRNGLPTILKEFPEMLSTCWPFRSAVQLTPNHLDWVQNDCEYCQYHVQAQYKKVSANRADLQSSYSGHVPKKMARRGSGLKERLCQDGFHYGGVSSMAYAASIAAASAPKKTVQTTLSNMVVKGADAIALEARKKMEAARKSSVQCSDEFKELLSAPTPGALNLKKHLSGLSAQGVRSDHDSEYESEASLDPDSPEFQSTVDSLIEAVNHALKVDDDPNSAPDHALSFTRTKQSHRVFASHPDFLDIVRQHRERPDKRFTGKKALGLKYPFSADLVKDWTEPPTVDLSSGCLFGEKLDQLISDATGGKSKFIPQQHRPKTAFQRQQHFRFRPFRSSLFWSSSTASSRSERSPRPDKDPRPSYRLNPSWRVQELSLAHFTAPSNLSAKTESLFWFQNTRDSEVFTQTSSSFQKGRNVRPILDLKLLNKIVKVRHLRMESLRSVISSLERGEFLASIDIKDVYLHIPVFPPHQRFLRFVMQEDHFQFTALPFGLATAPRVFTKVMAILHSRGVVVLPYLGRTFHQEVVYHACEASVRITLDTLSRLGWLINLDKSSPVPVSGSSRQYPSSTSHSKSD
ncbi:unnamed protein product [Ranitomeya imitator]|uniref:Reverse transcriptase domain-containing protein n=1 Tax=Ranitomeya imitator TaxID=111125 RepID=A0ABN9M517_9NEOB|nr:unnamed protein product [Ranitomeya imitator]